MNPFMVGNLYDLTGDGQSAIVARDDPRASPAAYAGDLDGSRYATVGPGSSPYADPASTAPETSPLAPYSYRTLDGAQPGFLGLTPWVLGGSDPAGGARDDPALAAGDSGSLESCEDGLAPGSGVTTGPCAENNYRATAIVAALRLP